MIKNLKAMLSQGAENLPKDTFSISPELMQAIDNKTIEKTGASLLTKEGMKNLLKSANLSEAILSGIDKWLNNDKKGALLTFVSGAIPLLWNLGMPGTALGITAASVVAAVIAKKIKKQKTEPTLYGDVKCTR